MAQQGHDPSATHGGRDAGKKARFGRLLVVAVVVVVVAAGVTYGLYIRGFLPFDENRKYSHTFTLKVDTDIFEEYTLVVPIPLNKTGTPYPGFLDELIDPQEELSISIVETPYGKALMLTGSEDATLRWDASWGTEDGDWYLNLSMTPGGAFEYDYDMRESWVYSDREDVRLSLSYSATRTRMVSPVFMSGGGPDYLLKGNDGDLTLELQAGWQNATIEYGYTVIN